MNLVSLTELDSGQVEMHSKRRYRIQIPRFFRLVVGMVLTLSFMVGFRIYGARIIQTEAECLRFPGNWLVDVNTGLTLEDTRPPRRKLRLSDEYSESPDHRYIAYFVRDSEQSQSLKHIPALLSTVVVEDVRSKQTKVLQHNVSYMVWSHNSKWLALEYYTVDQHLLMVTNPMAGETKMLVLAGPDVRLGSWTPDDAYLSLGTPFIGGYRNEFLSTSNFEITTTYTTHNKYLRWADRNPANGRVAFLESNDYDSWLTVIGPNEVARSLAVPIDGAVAIKLLWSSDGRSLFVHLHRSTTPIYLLFGIDDKSIRQLARIVPVWEAQVGQSDPLWIADQGYLLFWQLHQNPNRAELFSLRAQDGHLELLANDVALQNYSLPPLEQIYATGTRRLALHRRDQEDRASLELMDLDGKRRVILIEARQRDSISLPKWSSEYVAFTWTTGIAPNVTHRIVWSRTDGSGRGEMESIHPFSTGPWFLDGNQWIIFTVSRSNGSSRVGVVDVKSGTRRIFTENALLGSGDYLFVEPDEVSFWWMDDTGKGFDSYRLDGTRIFRFRSAERVLPDTFPGGFFLSPDGQLGAMLLNDSLQLAGRNDQPARVILSGASFIAPAWSPDGSRLAVLYVNRQIHRSPMIDIFDSKGDRIKHFEPPHHLFADYPSWISCE